uniref:hypothetical protein n=1 Tax=Halobacterium hubeiense TaxID=1407499 RepID=UPI00351ED525
MGREELDGVQAAFEDLKVALELVESAGDKFPNCYQDQLAVTLFEQPYVTSKTVQRLFDVEQSTASRAINELVDEGVLEEVPRHGRNKECRARETFEILEQPLQTY